MPIWHCQHMQAALTLLMNIHGLLQQIDANQQLIGEDMKDTSCSQNLQVGMMHS